MSTVKLDHKSKDTPHHDVSPSSEKLSPLDEKAISLFQQAVEREAQGLMSDAVDLYRKAFRMNDQVDKLYRSVHLPKAIQKLKAERGDNYLQKVDEHQVSQIDVDKLIAGFHNVDASPPDPLHGGSEGDHNAVTIKFSNLNLKQETVFSNPVSPLIHLPNEVWVHIMEILLHTSPVSWMNLSISCKKFAFLGLGQPTLWRQLAQLVYSKQVYDTSPNPYSDLATIATNDSYKSILSKFPFVKFNGCYISVVNYYSEGGKAEFSSSWSNPVRTITYYRYLRFYPDGTVLKVLSVLPPEQVVKFLIKGKTTLPTISETGMPVYLSDENRQSHKIQVGTWTMSPDGEVHIVLEHGAINYLVFHYFYDVKNVGAHRHGKLKWLKYYSVRKPSETEDGEEDDRAGEVMDFSIRNEKPFKFLRVGSYTLDS
ncbi:F-box protein HRT3 [Candida viswanathii]|uniref:F-box protein HRT3 n=1 Tax=Candida viswanathii TaxID=5486 RepID=A0A367Y141_9ASCO|nr:F-box protein HRT3 [Candida viswanathii]